MREFRKRVLIVDDEPAIRRLLVRFFSGQGWIADAFETADQAISAAGGGYDLAFVDIEIGVGPDGLRVAQAMRQIAPRTMVVLMSGSDGYDERARSLRLDPVLLKPFSLQSISGLLNVD